MSGLSCPYGYGSQYGAQHDCAVGFVRREITPYQSYQMADNFTETPVGKATFDAISSISGALAGKEKEAPKTQPAAPKWVKYAISGVVLALLAGGWMVLKKD